MFPPLMLVSSFPKKPADDIEAQQPGFIIKIPRMTVGRIVGPRIKAVKPGVLRGDRKFLNKNAVLIDAYGRIKPSPGRRVWYAVAYNQTIGPLASLQFNILSGFGELNATARRGVRFNGEAGRQGPFSSRWY